ncbi:NADH dehydrogenase subunit E [Roseivivax marinus]|uniref:NADH dehydrogenase subunit E n=1 Tax=Roseivivax marinus TaxID=1379903 RepID=W4HG92_9RHOB|nr:hypothetical protein [Roseivivax marinus]ETW11782.1 NADH dehydrogenase subunit E [Roseivivax marinus]
MNTQSRMSCQTGCWGLAAGVALVAFVLMLVVGQYGIIGAAFLAAVAFAVLGFLFSMIFCTPLTKPGEAPGPGVQARTSRPGATGAAPGTAGVTAGSAGATQAAPSAPAGTAATAPSGDKPDADKTDASADTQPPASGAAARDETGVGPADTPPAPGAAVADADAETGAMVKPSKALPGQQELSERKGSWRYEGNDTTSSAAGGASNGSAGSKPTTMSGPREGGADDLKKIKGIGPKLEDLCHSLGIYHFDQIASWTDAEVEWVDDNLEGFKGRVTRDEWVAQARDLSGGGTN